MSDSGRQIGGLECKLLPCPFCGSSIVGPLREWTDGKGQESPLLAEFKDVIHCGVCGCWGSTNFDKHEFVDQWNQRAKDDAALSLLAVIHGDGGQHTAAVGFEQSCKDAADLWYTRRNAE